MLHRFSTHCLLTFALLFALAGCLRDREAKAETVPANDPPPRALNVGEHAVFEFPADGYWHKSPYRALNGQTLSFTPAGDTQGLSEQAIRVQIDQVPYMVRDGVTFEITMPGRIGFKTENKFLPDNPGLVQVEIRRVK